MFTNILTSGPNDILTSHFHRILSAQSKGNYSTKYNQAITTKKFFSPHDHRSTGQLVTTVSTNRESPQQISKKHLWCSTVLPWNFKKDFKKLENLFATVFKFCCCHAFCIYCEICILTEKNADITKLLGDRALIWD